MPTMLLCSLILCSVSGISHWTDVSVHETCMCIKHEVVLKIVVWTVFFAMSWVGIRRPSYFTTGRHPGGGKWQERGRAVLSHHWCPPALAQRTWEKVDRTLSHYMSRSSLCMYSMQVHTIQYNTRYNTIQYNTIQYNSTLFMHVASAGWSVYYYSYKYIPLECFDHSCVQ